MSTESDLTRTFQVTLAQHRDREEHDRPVYHFRLMSLRDRRDFDQLLRRSQAYASSVASVLAGLEQDSNAPTNDESATKLKEAIDQLSAQKASEGLAIIEEAERLIKKHFAGWTRPETPAGEPIEGEFAPSRYDEVFDESDLEDLLHALPSESKLKAVDRKNSIARLTKNSEDAAPTAAEQPED